MDKNFLEDENWPVFKDIILMRELSKSRKTEGDYSIYSSWEDEEIWFQITTSVNKQLLELYKGADRPPDALLIDFEVDDVIERFLKYEKAYHKGNWASRIQDRTLSSLVFKVFGPKDPGPAIVPPPSHGGDLKCACNSSCILCIDKSFVAALEGLTSHIIKEEELRAINNISEHPYNKLATFLSMSVEKRVKFVNGTYALRDRVL